MKQMALFEEGTKERIVNVASIPQRSPFRYPGGKTWLVPRIRQWLHHIGLRPAVFIEPFAGGGIVSLTVAFEGLADSVLMVELDDQVAAVWETILCGDSEWLIEQIAGFDLSYDNVKNTLGKRNVSQKEKAFQTILKNRTYHGGILAPGSGLIKNGENGKGIKSRWYAATLCERIKNIVSIKDRITFIEGDGLEVLKKNYDRREVAYFIDPPYTVAGKKAGARLYKNNKLDHEELFAIASGLEGDFLMTYDNAGDVHKLAKMHGFETRAIPMKNTHHAEMTELLIGLNLSWVD
jgi:DNA adenine methylase